MIRFSPWWGCPSVSSASGLKVGIALLAVCGLNGSAAAEPVGGEEGGANEAGNEVAPVDSRAQSVKHSTPAAGYVPRYAFRRSGSYIESGLRVTSDQRSVEVARESFGPGGDPMGLEVPAHLGGGFLFLQPVASLGESTTALFRADTWTGQLTPMGRVPFVVSRAHFGFDRVYLLGIGMQIALDLNTREVLPLDPLPPLVTITGLQFEGTDRALVSGPLAGVLLTEDAGRSWRRVPAAESIYDHSLGSGLLVRTPQGIREVRSQGVLDEEHGLRTWSSPSHKRKEAAETGSSEGAFRSADERSRALSYLLEQGTVGRSGAIAILQGRAVGLQTKRGVSVRARPLSAVGLESCRGTTDLSQAGSGTPIFVCEDSAGTISVVSLTSGDEDPFDESTPLGVTRLLSPARRRVLLAGEGSIVVSGTCRNARENGFCLVQARGRRTFPGHPLKPGREALAVDGDVLLRVRLDGESKKIVVRRLGDDKSKPSNYDFSPESSEQQMLIWGSVLPQASLIENEVAIWVVHQERFVGMRLGDSRFPSAGAIQRPLSRATFAGPRAFLWGAAGFAKQSVDGGLHFTEEAVPFKSGDPQLATVVSPQGAVRVGCSEVGCSLGRYLRLGWVPRSHQPVDDPPRIALPSPGGGKLHFSCGLESPERGLRRPIVDSEFPSFWEEPAPAINAAFEAFSVGFSSGVGRLYGYGPREIPWGRRGFGQLYFVDPWAPDKVRKTAETLRLFPSALGAQEDLGVLERHTRTTEMDLDPAGDRGILLVRSRHQVSLFTFVEGQPLSRYVAGPDAIYRGLAGAVFSAQTWYAGFIVGREFVVARLGSRGIETVAELPLGDASPRGARLVRTTFGQMGVAMEGDRGLVVYPLSRDGELGQALLVPFSSERPPTCPTEAVGYVVDRRLSLSPYFSTPDSGPLELHDLEARMIVGYGGACLSAMSARTRSETPQEIQAPGLRSVPLSVLNHDSMRGRSQLICE